MTRKSFKISIFQNLLSKFGSEKGIFNWCWLGVSKVCTLMLRWYLSQSPHLRWLDSKGCSNRVPSYPAFAWHNLVCLLFEFSQADVVQFINCYQTMIFNLNICQNLKFIEHLRSHDIKMAAQCTCLSKFQDTTKLEWKLLIFVARCDYVLDI